MKKSRELEPIDQLISDAGYNFVTISNNIFLIENFIDDIEHEKLLSLTKSVNWLERNIHEIPKDIIQNHSSEEIIEIIKTKDYISSWADKAATITDELETIENIVNRIKTITPSGYSVNTFESINRQYDGADLPLHRDTDSNSNITYSMVIYLKNSSIGGEIYFKDFKTSILPPEKSLIIFDGNYWHGVNAASGKDTRYSMPSYMYKNTDIVQ